MAVTELSVRTQKRARGSILREGAAAGLAGAAVVALCFFVYDVLNGAPFRTPALLGAWLFHSARDVSNIAIEPGPVVKYTVIHVIAFLLFGWAAAGLFALADREPRVRFALFTLFCAFQVVALTLFAMLAAWLFEPLAWWLVVVANLAATAAMLLVFSRHHPIAVWRPDVLPPR